MNDKYSVTNTNTTFTMGEYRATCLSIQETRYPDAHLSRRLTNLPDPVSLCAGAGRAATMTSCWSLNLALHWNLLGELQDWCPGHPPREPAFIGLGLLAVLVKAPPRDFNMHPSLSTTDGKHLLYVQTFFKAVKMFRTPYRLSLSRKPLEVIIPFY